MEDEYKIALVKVLDKKLKLKHRKNTSDDVDVFSDGKETCCDFWFYASFDFCSRFEKSDRRNYINRRIAKNRAEHDRRKLDHNQEWVSPENKKEERAKKIDRFDQGGRRKKERRISYPSRRLREKDRRKEKMISIHIEIKPTVADDYPSILRQIKNQKCKIDEIGDKLIKVLLTREYIGKGASLEQFKKFFETERIVVVFEREIENFIR